MFKNLKRILVLIPCMVVAFFLFSGSDALAATKGDAILTNGEKTVVGVSNKKNTYYFSDDDYWEFLVTDYSLSAFKGRDRFVKWRVVRPDGQATEWKGNGYDSSVYYVDNKGRFSINNYASLSYSLTDTVDGFDRTTIAPGATYFVDIQYYSHLIYSTHQEGKDETLKIIVSSAVPVATIDYNSTTNIFNIKASFKSGESGVITDVKYMLSSNVLTAAAVEKSPNLVAIDVIPSLDVVASINGDTSSRYLYVVVTTGNGESSITMYDRNPGQGGGGTNGGTQIGSESDGKSQQKNETDDKGSGFGDYDLGEMILIILVIVLVVSCALIIAQKIVDYKKRLY